MGRDEHDSATTAPSFALTELLRGESGPPRTIAGRYELGPVIGVGASAKVFYARDRVDHREVAIKLFLPGAVTRQQREAVILRSLQHPGLVALYDFGTDDGQTYLAMRLVDGPTLGARLRSRMLSTPEITTLAIKLSEALAYIHGNGVTHRDLKPGNILLDGDEPLLGDFGIAHVVDATSITTTGEVVGTAAYMAPEQVLSEPVGAAADIYALGLVLLECFTGYREFTGTAVESAVARVHRQPVIPPDLPDGMTPLLRRMTARKPEKRPSANEIVTTLRGSTPAPARRHRVVAVLGVAGALSLAVTVGRNFDTPVPPEAPAQQAAESTPPAGTPSVATPAPVVVSAELPAVAQRQADPVQTDEQQDQGAPAKKVKEKKAKKPK